MNKLLRRIGLILVIAMLLLPVLCACDNGEETQNNDSKPVYMPTTAPELFVLPDRSVSLGEVKDGLYTSDYLQCTVRFDQKWTLRTAQQLQQLPEGPELESILDNPANTQLPQIHVLHGESATQRLALDIHYRLLNDYDRRRFAVMTEEEIVDAVLLEKNQLMTMYSAKNAEMTEAEKVKVTCAGVERTAILLTGTYNGHNHYILTLYDYQIGRYSVTVSLTSTGEDRSEALLEMFAQLNG